MEKQGSLKFYWHWAGERYPRYKTQKRRIRKRSMVICPGHRAQFFYLHPNARQYGEYFDLSECEYCKREKCNKGIEHYTEGDLKEITVKLIDTVTKDLGNIIHKRIKEWHLIRAIIRHFSKVGITKDPTKLIEPEKLDILLNERFKENENERNILSHAYEKGVLDSMYGRAQAVAIMDDMANKIFPHRVTIINEQAGRRKRKSNKGSKGFDLNNRA